MYHDKFMVNVIRDMISFEFLTGTVHLTFRLTKRDIEKILSLIEGQGIEKEVSANSLRKHLRIYFSDEGMKIVLENEGIHEGIQERYLDKDGKSILKKKLKGFLEIK